MYVCRGYNAHDDLNVRRCSLRTRLQSETLTLELLIAKEGSQLCASCLSMLPAAYLWIRCPSGAAYDFGAPVP